MKLLKFPFCILFSMVIANGYAQKKVTFPSRDGLIVTADLYVTNDTLPYMILCHQAGYSRGEYRETAPKFSKFGYNCLAVDLRSGQEVNVVENETAAAALKSNKPISYMDAEQDIVAAIEYAFKRSGKKVILVGSSYSASLALKIAVANEKVKAVLAFSPGEYFGDKLNVKESIKNLDKPIFVASSKDEAPEVNKMIKDVKSSIKQQCTPIEQGVHGSKTLWKVNPNRNEYWLALFMFMRDVK